MSKNEVNMDFIDDLSRKLYLYVYESLHRNCQSSIDIDLRSNLHRNLDKGFIKSFDSNVIRELIVHVNERSE